MARRMSDPTPTTETVSRCAICGETIDFTEGEGWFHSLVGPYRGHPAIPQRVHRDPDEHVKTVQELLTEAKRAGAAEERARIAAFLAAADPDAPGSDVPSMEYVRFSENEFFASAYNEAVMDALEWAAKKVALDPDAPTSTPEATS